MANEYYIPPVFPIISFSNYETWNIAYWICGKEYYYREMKCHYAYIKEYGLTSILKIEAIKKTCLEWFARGTPDISYDRMTAMTSWKEIMEAFDYNSKKLKWPDKEVVT